MDRKNRFTPIIVITMCFALLTKPVCVFAYTGSMGYEGGISAADPFENGEYSYREVCFLTGVPIVLEGTMTVKKSVRQGRISTTYTYDLSNTERDATLTRVIVMDTITENKENGQVTETSKVTRRPTEIVRVADTTYSLTGYHFSRSGITDPKPAVLYNAGEYNLTKAYQIDSGGTVQVQMTGTQYGYDQYWSSAKAGTVSVYISTRLEAEENPAGWNGYATVTLSSVAKKGFRYIENEPWQISFEGGYVEQNWDESILEYDALLPEFDKEGTATGVMKQYKQRLGISSEPVSTRLMVPDLKHLKGHWAEEPIKILFSLEIIPGTGEGFEPSKYVTRREFAAMLVRALKDIPEDPDMVNRTKTSPAIRSKAPEVSPFSDIQPDDPYYAEIKSASTRGIIHGTGGSNFSPDKLITFSEAVTMLIRAIGLESLAPYPDAVTPFVDNDMIPSYARNPAAAAYRIGLVKGDNRGFFHPNQNITYERASALIYRLVQYMGEELVKDYRDRFLDY